MTTALPSSRMIASAIMDLGDEKLQREAEYDRACRTLVGAGIPRVELALALDCPEVKPTESMRMVSAFAANPRGLLLIIGPNGAGKTFAATQMAIERHRAGKTTCWLAAVSWNTYDKDAQKSWLAAGDAAQVLVVDDLGAGASSGGWMRDQVEGLVVRKLGDGAPLVLLQNGTRAEAEARLGDRICSRMHLGGGIVELPVDSRDLRDGVASPEIDGFGRWPRWAQARALLDSVGHDDQGSWHRFDRRYRQLAAEAERHRDQGTAAAKEAAKDVREHLHATAMAFELPRSLVLQRAAELDAAQGRAMAAAAASFGLDVEEASLAGVSQALGRKIARSRRADDRPKEPKGCVSPGTDEEKRLHRMGYRVKPSALHNGWMIYHGSNLLADSPQCQSAAGAWMTADFLHRRQFHG